MSLLPRAVLAYHAVADVDPAVDPHRLATAPALLDAQIAFLQRAGYRFLTADELGGEQPRRGTAVLTFDDGWHDAVDTVLPILQRRGVRATFYVCTDWLGGEHPLLPGPAGRLLDEAGVRTLVEAGMEVGSHSRAHRKLPALDVDEMRADVAHSKARLEEITGRPCRTFAYPYGEWDAATAAAVRDAGYELGLAWRPGPWRRWAAPRLPAPPRHGARRLALKLLGIRRRA